MKSVNTIALDTVETFPVITGTNSDYPSSKKVPQFASSSGSNPPSPFCFLTLHKKLL